MRNGVPFLTGVGGFIAGAVVTLLFVRFGAPATQNVAVVPAPDSIAASPSLNATPSNATSSNATPVIATPVIATPVKATPTDAAPKAAAPKPPVTPTMSAKRIVVKSSTSNVDEKGSTQLIIPVLGITTSQLRDTYSDARGAGRRHDAIDIMAKHGTPVIAAAPATVVKRDHGARGGTALYALGNDGRTIYYYAHLDGYAAGVVEGTKLKAGDVVGYVGDTGNAGAGNYHLHFEITTTADPKRYWGGASTNPYPLLKKGITIKD